MRWDFASVFANTDALLAGAVGTVRIFAICLVLGLSLGLIVGLGRYGRNKWLYLPATAFVESRSSLRTSAFPGLSQERAVAPRKSGMWR